MNRWLLKIKPLVALLAIIVLLAPAIATPKKAEAITVTGGWLDNIWNIPQLTPIVAATAAETNQTLFEWAQTFVLETLKKGMLDLMRDQIINWIQGGGDPKFITDWREFLRDAGNIALGELAVRVAGAGICEPFRLAIVQSLTVPEPRPLTNGSLYGSSITCTLDDIVDNIENFYEDFEEGGWAAYNASWQIENNPISLHILTESAKYQTIAAAQHAAELEATTGNGFLSTKSCPEKPNSDSADIDRDGIKGDIAAECTITTPGSVIGDLVGKAVGSDFEYIIGANQLSAYIASIADALWNRLIREGVSGLLGVSTNSAPSGGYISDNTEGCAALGTPSLISSCEEYMSSNGGNFNATWDNLLDDIKTRKDELVLLRAAVAEWKEVADELNAYIIEKAAEESAECISTALTQHFSNPTPAGVASYAESVSTQLVTIDEQITLLDSYKLQIEGLESDDWATFIATASIIRNKLVEFAVGESAIEDIETAAAALEAAFDLDIRPDILSCTS